MATSTTSTDTSNGTTPDTGSTPAVTDQQLTTSGKTRAVKTINTQVPGLCVTKPASMRVIYYDQRGEPVGHVDLAPGHKDLDRMDLVFVAPDGNLGAMKGEEHKIDPGGLPMPPQSPKNCQPLANVLIKAEQNKLDEFSVYLPIPEQVLVTELNPDDPFESLLIPLVELQRRKRADYANDLNIFANFDKNAAEMELPDYTALEDCKSMVFRKLGRLNNLRGRDPQNEPLADSYRDLCVYSVLLYGLFLRDGQ